MTWNIIQKDIEENFRCPNQCRNCEHFYNIEARGFGYCKLWSGIDNFEKKVDEIMAHIAERFKVMHNDCCKYFERKN